MLSEPTSESREQNAQHDARFLPATRRGTMLATCCMCRGATKRHRFAQPADTVRPKRTVTVADHHGGEAAASCGSTACAVGFQRATIGDALERPIGCG